MWVRWQPGGGCGLIVETVGPGSREDVVPNSCCVHSTVLVVKCIVAAPAASARLVSIGCVERLCWANPTQANFYLGQFYLGQVLLRPILLRPILLRPGLLRPGLLRPGATQAKFLFFQISAILGLCCLLCVGVLLPKP